MYLGATKEGGGKLDDKLLSVEEAAELIGVIPETIRRWLRTGEIEGEKFGRLWRIRESKLRGKAKTQITESDQDKAVIWAA